MYKGQDCYPPEADSEVTLCDPGTDTSVSYDHILIIYVIQLAFGTKKVE